MVKFSASSTCLYYQKKTVNRNLHCGTLLFLPKNEKPSLCLFLCNCIRLSCPTYFPCPKYIHHLKCNIPDNPEKRRLLISIEGCWNALTTIAQILWHIIYVVCVIQVGYWFMGVTKGCTKGLRCSGEDSVRGGVEEVGSKDTALSYTWWDGEWFCETTVYDSLVISVVTYSAAPWTLTKAQQLRLDAFNTKALRRILGIRWYDRVTNTEVYALTGQHPLTSTIHKRRLGAFGHICRLPPGTQGTDILSSSAPGSWRRPRGRPPLRWTDQICEDIQLSHDDAVAATGDRAGWRALLRDATRTTTLAT